MVSDIQYSQLMFCRHDLRHIQIYSVGTFYTSVRRYTLYRAYKYVYSVSCTSVYYTERTNTLSCTSVYYTERTNTLCLVRRYTIQSVQILCALCVSVLYRAYKYVVSCTSVYYTERTNTLCLVRRCTIQSVQILCVLYVGVLYGASVSFTLSSSPLIFFKNWEHTNI